MSNAQYTILFSTYVCHFANYKFCEYVFYSNVVVVKENYVPIDHKVKLTPDIHRIFNNTLVLGEWLSLNLSKKIIKDNDVFYDIIFECISHTISFSKKIFNLNLVESIKI